MNRPETTDEPGPFDLLVVGSGPAGVHAAVAYVKAGGPGVVGLVSADHDSPYERPPLPKDVLAGDAGLEETPLLTADEDRSAWAEVDLRLGARVASLDTERRIVRTEAGQQLSYRSLVVATGSEALDLPGTEQGAPVFALRSLEQARRGVRTILVTPERVPQAPRLGDWAGARIAEWLTELDVELLTETKADAIDRTGTLQLDNGSRLRTDLVLAAVGVSQSRSFLDESGLQIAEGRAVVDAELRTSDPRVWVVEHGKNSFTVWYADASGELVGVLTHDHDEDYERGGELPARRASAEEARGTVPKSGSR